MHRVADAQGRVCQAGAEAGNACADVYTVLATLLYTRSCQHALYAML